MRIIIETIALGSGYGIMAVLFRKGIYAKKE
jgi:hypothetical protein